MALYRGPGGSGDATADAANEAAIIAALVTQAQTSESNASSSASAAATSATNASNSASSASSSASSASTSASNAASSASAASTSASNAASSASAASTSASNAATSATNAANSYDSFDDRYLGAKATAPTLDNDGDALLTGALYWNTATDEMFVWDGTQWVTLAGTGTVTSVAMTVPTGLSVAGSPVTTTGTLAVTYASGYAIPTTAKQTEWDTAYSWGNHASAGYLTSAAIGSTVQGYDGDLNAIAALSGTSGFLKKTAANTWSLDTNTYLTSETYTGTVTSVAMTVPTGLTVSGTPITSSGTFAVSLQSGYAIPTTTKQSNWDDSYTFVSNFPTQTGNSGKYLTTNGSTLSWGTVTVTETDPIVGAVNGIVKANGSGTISAATAGTDYLAPAAIGTTVQAYDSNLTSFVTTFTLPTTDGTNGQILQTNGSGVLSFVTNTGGSGISMGKAIAAAIVFG